MKLFSLLLGAALVSGASAAACDTCRAGGFVATCTSKTVDLTCKVPTTGKGNFLDATAKECKQCENQFTKTCTSATVGLTCRTTAAGFRGNFLDSATAAATPVCKQCDATCATCSAAAANKCITCIHGLFGGGAAGSEAACGTSCAAAAATGTVDSLKALTCASATKATTCPAFTVLGGVTGSEVCIKCKAHTATCTKDGTTTTQASTVSVNCLTGFGGAAGTCAACQVAGGDLVVPVSCESATKATTCPTLSVLGGVAGSEKCILCSANTVTCTKSGVAVTKASTISTKCSSGFYVKAGSPATCVACTSEACTTGTKMKKFASAAAACPLGTDTANPGLAATNCMSCQGGLTCTAAVTDKAPVGALTCAATSQKGQCDADDDSVTCKATRCLPGAFGDNVSICLANCANVDGTANAEECACGKDTPCAAGQGCTAADLTKAGACADIKKQAAKKSPASTMQASALLSAAALLVAMRQ